jgi:hypothetical protein
MAQVLFEADQILTPGIGFVWRPRVRLAASSVDGSGPLRLRQG